MTFLKYVVGGLALAAAVGTSVVIYKWWKNSGKVEDESENESDDEENNWPEMRYGPYKNPTPGPSWRLEPGEYYNPAD
ncbi:hypothetical protein OS493_012430 [Desmophyllum pertusum]|uniref:Uncharacterized protein n=1 Tax=Desmophyllum pertusum TaxID=174260 RepID=A0A9W9ZRZ5_9CNID|nr:hypothetical protein OS493_012430 [Desmophyllum pertusum]